MTEFDKPKDLEESSFKFGILDKIALGISPIPITIFCHFPEKNLENKTEDPSVQAAT